MFKNHKKRVEKIKDFAGKNKVFVFTMIVAIIFLFVNFVIQPHNNNRQDENQAAVCENGEVAAENTVCEIDEPATEIEPWRFYFIDVIILVAGGGFCVVMILRQRRKTREELK